MTVLYAAVDLPLAAAREAATEAPLERLPEFERLAWRARRAPAPADWRRWALALAGLEAPPGDLPLGRLVATAAGFAAGTEETWLLLTPLALRAGLVDVRVEAVASALDAVAAGALARRFNAEWPAQPWRLHAAGGQLLLRHAGALELSTSDPATLIGAAASSGQPVGPDAGPLRRLASELEMWLHADSSHERDFNALWPWAGGRGSLAGEPAWPELALADIALAAARACHPGGRHDARLVRWSLAELAVRSDPLAAADSEWFGRLAAELRQGLLEAAELHLAGVTLALRPRQRLKAWVRSRPWWELAA